MFNYFAVEAQNHRVCSGLHRLYRVGNFFIAHLSNTIIYLSLFNNYN